MLCSVLVMIIVGYALARVENNNGNITLTLGLSVPWDRVWNVGMSVSSAIILGIKEVERRQLLPGYQIEWIWRDSYCNPRRGIAMAVDMWTSVNLSAIIGDGCSAVCEPQALLAAAWNIPVISWACNSPSLSDKSIYPTFSRCDISWLYLGYFFDNIVAMFGWQRVCIITITENVYTLTAEFIKQVMEKQGKDVIYQVISSAPIDDKSDLKHIMKSLKSRARIFFCLAYEFVVKDILLIAVDLGMMNGEYIFLCDNCQSFLAMEYPYQTEKKSLAFEGIIGMSLKNPSGEEYDKFRQEVIDAFQSPLFANVTHIEATVDIDAVPVNAGKNGYY